MFDRNGKFLSKFVPPDSQQQRQQLEKITGIAVNSQILVVSYHAQNNCIRVYDVNTHRCLYQFGSSGYEDSQFNHPEGVALDDKKVLIFINPYIDLSISSTLIYLSIYLSNLRLGTHSGLRFGQ